MPTTIKLCAPNLEEFNCLSSLTQDWYLENCSPLSRVDFDIILKAMEDESAEAYLKLPSAEKDVYAKRMMKYLGAVYMVEKMRLSAGFLEVLSQALDISECQPPRLCNLQTKESNLAVIGDDWEAGLSLPGMLSHLEYVSIEEVEGCDAELKLLSFLLKNAKVLKKLALHPRSAIDSPDSVRKQFQSRLRALPRASPHIIMHWPATKSTHLI